MLSFFTICSNEVGDKTGGRIVSGFVKEQFTERHIMHPGVPIPRTQGRDLLPALIVRVIRLIGYLHESLTIFTCVTVRCPCSSLVFFMSLSFAASFASSFMLCAVALDTTPVAVTV
jgi:hypothetical protein